MYRLYSKAFHQQLRIWREFSSRFSVNLKSKLLQKEDYDKILKMQPNEIAKYLGDKGYSDEMNKLANNFSGHELVDAAIAMNMEATLNKLKRISNPELRSVMQLYLNRNDIWNLKNIFRSIAKKDRKGVSELFLPIGRFTRKQLDDFLKLETSQDVLKQIKPFYGEFKGKPELVEIEEWLTKNYFENALVEAKNLPSEGNAFRQFIINEVTVLNIITIFKMKSVDLKPEDIQKKLFLENRTPRIDNELMNLHSIPEMFKALYKTQFKDAADEGLKEWERSGSLLHFETALYRKLLKENLFLLHKFPLSIDVILGYMFAKNIEAKNLRLVTKGRELGLSNEFIERELIV